LGDKFYLVTFIQPKQTKDKKHNKMSVTLRQKPNADKSISLYLDVYHNKKRHKEYLKECKLYKATTPVDRQKNRETLEMAKNIALKRAQELASQGYDVVASFKHDTDFIGYFESYISKYTKKDKRNMEGACNKFKDFMQGQKIASLTMKQLTENIVCKYAEYLKDVCEGEGAASYFARFKKMLKQAMREKVIISNPAEDVSIKKETSIIKHVLTIEEISILAAKPISNMQVRNAFLFCCFTGLSWVDVKELKWKHIDMRNLLLTKVRAKTGTETVVTLNETAVSLLPEAGERNELVFALPSHTGALKTLTNWLKAAKIDKHITWHCARHSFATNLVYYKADVTIVAKLLGHSTLKYTQRYAHVAEEMKRNAVNNLPKIIV
jgi:integrase/recombinase XerD